jgi:hypothetical protein
VNQGFKIMAVLVAGVTLAPACAKTSVKKNVPVKKAAEAEAPVPVKGGSKSSYVVKKGDSLWKISGKAAVLGDSFRWPLLFKANRDQIEDPDLIDAKLDLSYKKDYSKDEVEDAVKKAKDTPPFVPHAAPRKSLPVKY